MIYLVALAPTAILAFFLWWEKRDRAIERSEWAQERSGLLQRIQAPRAAVASHQAENAGSDGPLYVSPEDDAAWDDYVEARAAGELN